jgi:hypothetical protein
LNPQLKTVRIKGLYHASLLKLRLSGKIELAASAAGKAKHPMAGSGVRNI